MPSADRTRTLSARHYSLRSVRRSEGNGSSGPAFACADGSFPVSPDRCSRVAATDLRCPAHIAHVAKLEPTALICIFYETAELSGVCRVRSYSYNGGPRES